MKNNDEKVTYTTFDGSGILAVVMGIGFAFILAFTVLMLYVMIVIFPEEFPNRFGRCYIKRSHFL